MREPLVILDCAHNEFAIEALLETIAVELGPRSSRGWSSAASRTSNGSGWPR